MKLAHVCSALLIAGMLAACSSPPVQYHTLNVAPAATSTVQPAPFVIYLLPTGVPPQVDIPQVVVMTGNDRVSVLDNDRWLSPVGDEFQSALSSALTTRLNTQDVSGIASRTSRPVLFIRVQIRRFENWPGQFVKLQADWSLRKDKVQQICRVTLIEDASGGMDEMFSAQQRVVLRLAEAIAQRAMKPGQPINDKNLFCE